MATLLLERDRELDEMTRLLDQAVGGAGSVVVVSGPAGAGKTTLIDTFVSDVARRGVRVLRATGGELERDLGFGVVRTLFATAIAKEADVRALLMTGAAAFAAPVLWSRSTEAPQPGSVLHGLFWLCSNLSERTPLLVVVDDVQWADPASLRFLGYLSRRISGLPVLLTLGLREGAESAGAELLAALLADPATNVVRLPGLSPQAIERVVADRFGKPPAEEFVTACHEATGGNPFLLTELLTALVADGRSCSLADARRVGAVGPTTVARSVLARVAGAGPGAGALAEAAAVLGSSGELRHAAVLADLDQPTAALLADALASMDVFAPGRPIEFVHPLVGAAIYQGISPGARSNLHRAAAGLLADDGVAPDRVAMHLLAVEPARDPWVVASLCLAASVAVAAGAPDQAATYLERAMREPPVASDRPELLYWLGEAELLAGRTAAGDHLARALETTTDPVARGELAVLLSRAALSAGRLPDAWTLLTRLIDQLEGASSDVVMRLEAGRAAAGLWTPRLRAELEADLPRLQALAEHGGDAARSLLLLLGFAQVARCDDRDQIFALVERGLDGGRFLAAESAEAVEVTWAARTLTFIDALDEADRLLDAMVADARTRGSVAGYATACTWRAAVALRRGRIVVAEAEAREAVQLLEAHDLYFLAPYAFSFLGEALIESGELAEAERLLDRADLGPMRGSAPESRLALTRARLRMARGDESGAVSELRDHEAQNPWLNNPNALAWRSTLALALPAALRAEATKLVDLELEQARRIGQPRAIGVALRAAARLCSGPERVDVLREAVAELEACPSLLEQAYALTDLGSALRQSSLRAEARDTLARALDMASTCGARALADRARDEMVIAGARPRRDQLHGAAALTPSEQRVAEMAAIGMSNREIAQALFVTMKTVAQHLTHVYEKLRIAGRLELGEALQRAD